MTTLSDVRNELLPGLRGVEGMYETIPQQWDAVYNQAKSEMAMERTSEMRFLGLAALKQDGGPTQFDNAAGDRFMYNTEHIELALGYYITRRAIEDNLYKAQFNPANLGLGRSFKVTKDILGASVFNTATTYNPSVVGDGVALLASNHPYDGGTWANTPTIQVDLNEATLEAALIQIRTGFYDIAGLKVHARGRKMVVPPQLEYVAKRILGTENRPGTADNDINAVKATGQLPEGYFVWDYLTSSYAWFLLTNLEGLVYFQREPYETDMQVDFTTDNLLVKARERFSFGYYNPRALWGTTPTS